MCTVPFCQKDLTKSRCVWVCMANAALVATFWLSFVSHGFSVPALVDGVYDIQAAAISQGQLAISPGPMEVFFHDALMYFGSYYFYWGLLPSAWLVGVGKLLGRGLAHYSLVFFCFLSLAYGYQQIIWLLLKTAVGDSPTHPLILPLCSALLTWVLLFIVPYPLEYGWFFFRFVVYEQQILFGLALAVPGVYMLLRGILTRRPPDIAVAATLFSLAAWTRVTWFPLAFIVVGMAGVCTWRWRDARADESPLRSVLIAVVPGVLALAGLMLLNYLRFESLFDFGVRYQNPGHHVYFRNLKLFFSPETRLWNALFNLASYFVPPHMVEHWGLFDKAFAYSEGVPPSFFFFNPQFLILVVLTPLALYRAYAQNKNMITAWTLLISITGYLLVIFGLWGTMVIMRYFIEFYYFMILAFLALLLMLLRPIFAAIVLLFLLAVHIPDGVRAFQSVQPELRILPTLELRDVKQRLGSTPFLEAPARWPRGMVSGKNLRQFPSYATLGISQGPADTLLGQDILTAYLVPPVHTGLSRPFVCITGIRSIDAKGMIQVYVENRLVHTEAINRDFPLDITIPVPFPLPKEAPYQVMLVFLRDGESYLRPRSSGYPTIQFRTIELDGNGGDAGRAAAHLPSRRFSEHAG